MSRIETSGMARRSTIQTGFDVFEAVREGVDDLPLDLGGGHGRGDGDLAHDQFLGLFHHLLLAEGEGFDQAEVVEALQHRDHIEDRARPHQVHVLLVAAFPVHRDFDLAVLHVVEDLFHRPLGDELPDADLLSGRGGDENEGVVGQDAEMEDVKRFPVEGFVLDVFDDAQALIGIYDPITNLEGIHVKTLYWVPLE